MGKFSRSKAIKRLLAESNIPRTEFCQLCGKLLTYQGWAIACHGRLRNFGRICDDCSRLCSSKVRKIHRLDYSWKRLYAENVVRKRGYGHCESCGIKVSWREKKTFLGNGWKNLLNKIGWREARKQRKFYSQKFFLCEACFQRIKKSRYLPKTYIDQRAKGRYLRTQPNEALMALEINCVATNCTIEQWLSNVPSDKENDDWNKRIAPHVKRIGRLHGTDYYRHYQRLCQLAKVKIEPKRRDNYK